LEIIRFIPPMTGHSPTSVVSTLQIYKHIDGSRMRDKREVQYSKPENPSIAFIVMSLIINMIEVVLCSRVPNPYVQLMSFHNG
jgi:hypothetical protein